jgi:hypothetical protein
VIKIEPFPTLPMGSNPSYKGNSKNTLKKCKIFKSLVIFEGQKVSLYVKIMVIFFITPPCTHIGCLFGQ